MVYTSNGFETDGPPEEGGLRMGVVSLVHILGFWFR